MNKWREFLMNKQIKKSTQKMLKIVNGWIDDWKIDEKSERVSNKENGS